MDAKKLLRGRITCRELHHATKSSGVLILTHTATGWMFIAYASDLYIRMAMIRRSLEYNKFYNKKLQEAYNDDSNVEILCCVTQSIDEAIVLKQGLLNECIGMDILFNKNASAKRARYRNRTEAEIKVRKDTIDWDAAWMRWIDGTNRYSIRIGSRVYKSAAEASAILRLSESCINKRIRSIDFPAWVRIGTARTPKKTK